MSLVTTPARRLFFIGDSITDVGRRQDPEGLGNGYVARIRELLLCRDLATAPEVINRGVSGDTVRHLEHRWAADVLEVPHDLLSVKIGVNDVWRVFSDAPHEAVPEDEFYDTLHRLLLQARTAERRLVLVTPFMVEPRLEDEMRVQVVRRAAVVKELAREMDATLVELQPLFDRVMATTPPELWSADRIHPTRAGHLLIAQEWLRVTGI